LSAARASLLDAIPIVHGNNTPLLPSQTIHNPDTVISNQANFSLSVCSTISLTISTTTKPTVSFQTRALYKTGMSCSMDFVVSNVH